MKPWSKTHILNLGYFLLAAVMLSSCSRVINDCNGSCGKIYVANQGNETITVIDASNYEVVKFIRTDSGEDMMMVHNIQASPDGSTVWATYNYMDSNASGILVVDPNTDVITKQVTLGNGWNVAHIVFDSLSQFAYIAATDSGFVAEVNTATCEVTRKFYIGTNAEPHGLRYASGKLYIANMVARSMTIVDLSANTLSAIPVGGMAIQTAITSSYAFASLYDVKRIFRYDRVNGDTISFALPAGAQGPIQMYSSGDQLLICDQGILLGRPASDKVYIMDITSGAIESAVTVGDGAHGIVCDPYGRHAFCTNTIDNSVSVIDIATARVLCTIPVGVDPNGITFWRAEGGQP